MYVFFDFETSDLPRRGARESDVNAWPRIVQLAWVSCDQSGHETGCHEAIVRPDGFLISEGAAAVHGISTERAMCEGVALAPTLSLLVAALTQADVWVAHNVQFERPVLYAECNRASVPAPRLPQRVVCTMAGSTNYCKLPGPYGYKWPKLSELHLKLFGEPFEGAHGALADARACMRCYFRLSEHGVAM